MKVQQWNKAIDLWNEGKSLGDIAAEIGVGIYELTGGNSLLGVVSRLGREMVDAGAPDDAPIKIPDRFKEVSRHD